MEFHEKLQELRKKKGITQEQLASSLFVSRTAVSKWESGRGYPNIDSLKALAGFFGVTVDELISGEELLDVAQKDTGKNRDLVFGLLDCSVGAFLFLPVFGQREGEFVRAVSLLFLQPHSVYLQVAYWVAVLGLTGMGILSLTWRNKGKLSVLCNALAALLFILGQQPYGAMILVTYLVIKTFLLLKKP